MAELESAELARSIKKTIKSMLADPVCREFVRAKIWSEADPDSVDIFSDHKSDGLYRLVFKSDQRLPLGVTESEIDERLRRMLNISDADYQAAMSEDEP